MARWFADLARSFTPPNDSWWFPPMAWGIVSVLGVFLALAYWPRKFTLPPISSLERRLTKLPTPLRMALGLALPMLAVLLPASSIILCFGPRSRSVVILDDPRLGGGSASDWDGRIPEDLRHLKRIDARPIVARALAIAASNGAAHWLSGSASERGLLRKACIEALKAYARGEVGSEPSDGVLPGWVEKSAEMTIVLGLSRCLENVEFVGVRARPSKPDAEWHRAIRLMGRDYTRRALFAEAESRRPVVRSLFDGRSSDANGKVHFWALIEGHPEASNPTEVVFTISDPSRDHRVEIRRKIPGKASWTPLEVDGLVTGFAANDHLVVMAEAGTIREELPMTGGLSSGGGTFRASLRGNPSTLDALLRTWSDVLGPTPTLTQRASPLRENLALRGLRVPELVKGGAGTGPSIEIVDGRGVLILAPGLTSDSFRHEVCDQVVEAKPSMYAANPSAIPAEIPLYEYHVAEVAGRPSLDSFISVSVGKNRLIGHDNLPVTSARMQTLARAWGVNVPPEEGRKHRADNVVRPVMEIGQDDSRPFVFIRLDPAEQRLFLDDHGLCPPGFEPGRTRAFMAELAWATNRVLQGGTTPRATASDRASGPEPAAMLDWNDQDMLIALGRRGGDSFALALIGLYQFALSVHLVFWDRRPNSEVEV